MWAMRRSIPLDATGTRGYESFYLKAADPAQGLALWIRYTVHKRPGHPAEDSAWVTLFDRAAPGPLAAKQTGEGVSGRPSASRGWL